MPGNRKAMTIEKDSHQLVSFRFRRWRGAAPAQVARLGDNRHLPREYSHGSVMPEILYRLSTIDHRPWINDV